MSTPRVRTIILEVPVESANDAALAVTGGANRLELCTALALDGLTPSIGLIRTVRRLVHVPLMVMIRPRGGEFIVDQGDYDAMGEDIEAAVATGADGLVFGALTDNGSVDRAACRMLVQRCGNKPAVFHRAFDQIVDPLHALEELVDLGFARVLASGARAATGARGGKATATDTDALDRLCRWVDAARGRIEILPGGGIRASNIAPLLARTVFRQVHSSCRTGTGGGVDAGEVRALRMALDLPASDELNKGQWLGPRNGLDRA